MAGSQTSSSTACASVLITDPDPDDTNPARLKCVINPTRHLVCKDPVILKCRIRDDSFSAACLNCLIEQVISFSHSFKFKKTNHVSIFLGFKRSTIRENSAVHYVKTSIEKRQS